MGFIEHLPLAYGIKKIYKDKSMDFSVSKLEGLWWVEGDKPALETPREQWQWKLLIRMPDFIKETDFKSANNDVSDKKKNETIKQISFEKIKEGPCAQIMHIGPYATESDTIKRLFDYIEAKNMTINGLHHETYLSDPNKTAAEKMKTIIRYPVK